MVRLRKIVTTVTVGLMAVVALPSVVGAVASTQIVTNGDVSRQAEDTPPAKSWVIYSRTGAETGTFRNGPATPPLGTGSLELTTPTGTDKITVFNFDHTGASLSSVNALNYSTYRSAGSDQQVAALNLQVDINGAAAGGFTTLVFEPVYNTAQGAVVSNAWQNWDAYNGGNAIWWSSNPINGAPNRDTFVSWNTIVAANPDAVIVGGVGVNQGSGNPGLTTAVDKFIFNDTTYDFELNHPAAAVPTGLAWKNPDVPCGGTTNSMTITADWNDADNAVKYRYSVTTPTNYQVTPYEEDVIGSERNGTFNDGEGVYTFKVASYNSDGVLSAYSTGCSITYQATVTPPNPVVATSKEQCKNGGYVNFVDASGKSFKNQGDCVSFVASGGKGKS